MDKELSIMTQYKYMFRVGDRCQVTDTSDQILEDELDAYIAKYSLAKDDNGCYPVPDEDELNSIIQGDENA